jgi:AcrR family transcriptional regulator
MRRVEDIDASEPQRRVGGRSARVRAAVLRSAFELLLEKGFEAFAIGEVAARAGVHETSVYRRWRTRGALALDACLTFAEDVIPIPDTGALRSDLIALLSDVRGLLLSPQGRALIALVRLGDTELDIARRSFWTRRLGAAAVIIHRAVARHEIAPRTDARIFLETLIAPLYFRVLVSLEPIETWPIADLIDRQIASWQVTRRRAP